MSFAGSGYRLIAASFLLLVVLALSASATFAAEEKPTFTKSQKAFYLSEQQQNFIRPGLVVEITEASIDVDGTIRTRFRVTDPAGVPLDRNGIFSPGPVDTRFIVAVIPAGQRQYVAYATRTRMNSVTNVMVTQATSDSGGTYEQVGEGEYVYTFATRAPADIDRSATHTIGVYARRDLREFDLERPSDDDTFDFVPDGSEVTVVRDIVRTETCNNCHTRLTLHGRRHSVELCVLCHQPQSVDDESVNTVDFKVMIHKIHRGANLPSVEAGTPYEVAGNDYSTVEFPADVRRCSACHTQDGNGDAANLSDADAGGGAAMPARSRVAGLTAQQKDQVQGGNYLTHPSRAACGSCHDNVNFATGENHASLPQVSDNQCSGCHIPQGELEFDLSIVGAHTIDRFSKELRGVNFELMDITNTGPGENPTVTFSVLDNRGNPIIPSEMNRLRLMLAGPATDISQRFDFEDARSAQGTGGVYSYTMETAIPADAQGTWVVGIEGRNLQTLLSGTEQEMADVRDLGENKVLYFPVTDSIAVPRRKVVAQKNCEACHVKLRLHGGNRTNVDYCVLCHNPLLTDVEERPEGEPGENVNFKNMIHKIHTGEDLDPGAPFIVEGTDFGEVRFPGDRRKCTICHIEGTQQIPLQDGLLSTANPYDYLTEQPPITGACLSCHNHLSAAAHAELNASEELGESCAVCHGEGADFSVDRVHAR